jgi:hypothetical protein
MTTDALLGGLENVRYHVGVLIDAAHDSHEQVADALQGVDDDLSEIVAELEEDAALLSAEDQEVLDWLRSDGMLSCADIEFAELEEDDE